MEVLAGIGYVWLMGSSIAFPIALMFGSEAEWDLNKKVAFGLAWPLVFLIWIAAGLAQFMRDFID